MCLTGTSQLIIFPLIGITVWILRNPAQIKNVDTDLGRNFQTRDTLPFFPDVSMHENENHARVHKCFLTCS